MPIGLIPPVRALNLAPASVGAGDGPGLGLPLLGFAVVLVAATLLRDGPLWLRARRGGAPVGLGRLLLMRFRNVDAAEVVDARLAARQAGLDVSVAQLEAHLMCGGRPLSTVSALIAARRAQLALTYDQAMAIDLMGRDVLAVTVSAIERGVSVDEVLWPGRGSGAERRTATGRQRSPPGGA